MKARLRQPKSLDETYGKKHKRRELEEAIENFKNSLDLLDLFFSEKTDEKLIEEFKEKHPDLELSENQEITVNNLYGNRYACVCRVHEDGSRTFFGAFDDEYFNDIQKYLKK